MLPLPRRRRRARALLPALVLAALAPGCHAPEEPPPDAHVDDVPTGDDAALDGPAPDVAEGPDSGCPPPRPVGTGDVPPGYLAPTAIALRRAIDGDTARFVFASGEEQTVRFLFVNTEEPYGDEATAFGMETSVVVGGYLAAARETTLVVRESRRTPGAPDTDSFGRWLGLVFVDGELLQTRIVREGLSPYYTQFGCATEPLHSNLLHAEAEARAHERGVWRPGHPTDYSEVLARWIGRSSCRPNPYLEPYCP